MQRYYFYTVAEPKSLLKQKKNPSFSNNELLTTLTSLTFLPVFIENSLFVILLFWPLNWNLMSTSLVFYFRQYNLACF